MQIGHIKLDAPVIFAPMAGISDLVNRRIVRAMGAGLTYSEMVSAKALVHGNAATKLLLRTDDADRPCSLQIFGSDPEAMGTAAKLLEDTAFEIIDINSGCPARKIVQNGDGSALMKNPELTRKIIQSVKANTSKPVTIKIRLGWDWDSINCIEIAKIAEDCGVSAITVHGRTRSMMFGGEADWSLIKAVKNAVSVPVIGNGDVCDPIQTKRLMVESGVDAVMIGRASYGNPWVFKRIAAFLTKGELLPEPNVQEKIDMALEHARLQIEYNGEKVALREIRKHIAWYIKGIKNATEAKVRVNNSESFDEVRAILEELSCG